MRILRPSAGLALALVLLALPLVPLALRAVAGPWRWPAVLPSSFTVRGLRTVVDPGSQVLPALGLSTAIAAAVALLACVVAWPAARVLGTSRFRGRGAITVLLLTPAVVPTLASALGLQVFFLRIGLAGHAAGVVLVQLVPALPYALAVLTAGFAGLDPAHEAQARVLGAGPVRRWCSVTVPLLRAPLVVAAVLAFLVSWSDYLLALLVGAGRVQTLPVQLYAAVGATDTTIAAAVALTVIVPPLVLLLVLAGPLTRAADLASPS